jgi:gamma-glutamyltranspeptidase / glutathione hydrolase
MHVEPDLLSFEAGLDAPSATALAEMFPRHTPWGERNMFFGGVHTVARAADGDLSGIGDPRRGGVCLIPA